MLFSPFIEVFKFFSGILKFIVGSVSHVNFITDLLIDVVFTVEETIYYIFPEELAVFVVAGIILSIFIRFFVD